jgi:glutathione S-transferase
MNLYFSPLACSLASRIALYEADAPASYTQVDLKTKRVMDGGDFFAVNSMGQVPVILTEQGDLITENTAILQFIAASFPQAKLAPESASERAQLQKWLGFIGTELHKAVFVPLLDHKAGEAVKEYSRGKLPLRFDVLQRHLDGRDYLLDSFSIADAYLVTVLNWAGAAKVDLSPWPAVTAYQDKLLKRASVAKAVGEEYALYKAEQAIHAAA